MKTFQSNSSFPGLQNTNTSNLTKVRKNLLINKIGVAFLTTFFLSIPSICRADFNTSPPQQYQGLTSIINCQTYKEGSNIFIFIANWTLTNNPAGDKITRINNMYLEYSNQELSYFDYLKG